MSRIVLLRFSDVTALPRGHTLYVKKDQKPAFEHWYVNELWYSHMHDVQHK